ncbi:MAG: hypothetical protein R6T98_14035 [Desulfatiglandales bacterium]
MKTEWASEGWNPQNAAEELSRFKRAQRTGEGSHTLAERREREKIKKEMADAGKSARPPEKPGKKWSATFRRV